MKPIRLAAVSLLCVASLAACGSSSSSSSTASSSSSSATTAAGSSGAPASAANKISLTDFAITPMAVTATAGNVSFDVSNDGQSPHNFEIRDSSGTKIGGTKDLNPKGTENVTVALKAGTYVTYCSEPGHESLGMKGTLTVS